MSDDTWARRVPEPQIMDDAAENAAYDRIATRWLDRAIYPALIKELNADAARRVFDVCSGTGRVAIALARALPKARIRGVDLSAGMLRIASRNCLDAGVAGRVSFVRADVSSTPFPDGVFDAAVSYGSLHHWTDPAAVFADLARVVSPGGRILIGDWRRDPALLRFFRSRRGTLEGLLIEASARAAYLVDEVEAMLAPLGDRCEWHAANHPMGLLIRGRVLA